MPIQDQARDREKGTSLSGELCGTSLGSLVSGWYNSLNPMEPEGRTLSLLFTAEFLRLSTYPTPVIGSQEIDFE